MDFVTGLFSKAKEAVTGTPASAPASVTDGYPAPTGARRKRKGGKKTRKGGKSRRKTARRV